MEPRYRDRLAETPTKGPRGVEGSNPVVAEADLRPGGWKSSYCKPTGLSPTADAPCVPRRPLAPSDPPGPLPTRPSGRESHTTYPSLPGSFLSKATLVRKGKSRPGFHGASVPRGHVQVVRITGDTRQHPGSRAWGQGRLLGSTSAPSMMECMSPQPLPVPKSPLCPGALQ